jgi:SanA protein
MLIKNLRKYTNYLLLLLGLMVIFTVIANWMVIAQTQNQLTSNINSLPKTKCGLLLGTSKLIKGHRLNGFFINRINAAVELYKAGVIECVIVSGDNRALSYNEPREMRRDLLKKGIPDSAIYLDFAGFRTLDSVVRAKEIFGQENIIIISQKQHNERAVFIANHFGINAIGYNAQEPSYSAPKTRIREYFARVKVLIDIVIDQKPHFLGEKILVK